EPSRMRRAVVIAEARDLLRVELDLPRRRLQPVLVRIGAEVAEQHVFLGSGRNLQVAALPERIEIGDGRGVGASAPAHLLVEMTEPRLLAAPLRVSFGNAEPLRKRGEDVEVVAR